MYAADVPLTTEQEKAYIQMKKLALAKLDNGELATTSSVLTQIMRLQTDMLRALAVRRGRASHAGKQPVQGIN